MALKLAFSGILITYTFRKIDITQATLQLRNIGGFAVLVAVTVLAIQLCVAALRLRNVLRALGARSAFLPAIDVVLVGAFFSQTLISFVGGDAMRVWRITRANAAPAVATNAVVLDRLAGFAGILGLVLLTLPFLLRLVSDQVMRSGLLIALIGGILAVLCAASVGFLPTRWWRSRPLKWLAEPAGAAQSVLRSGRGLAMLLALSLTIQLLNVIAVYVLALGLSLELTFWHGLLVFPPVLFLSMLPISVSGWGVREGAMAVGLALVGIEPARSVALSLCFGLLLVGVSLPGGFLWLLQGRGAGPAAREVEADVSQPGEGAR